MYIKRNYSTQTNAQLSINLGIKLTTLRTKMYSMGIKRMEMEYFTPEMVDFLKENYAIMGDAEICEIFEQRWPKNKRWLKKHIAKKRGYLNLFRTKDELKQIHERNVLTGRFKSCPIKAWLTRGVTPVGELHEWHLSDGNKVLVIKTEKGFVHYKRYLWETMVGPIPKGYVVRTKDNNHLNIHIDNLECITRQEHAKRNAIWNMPNDWIENHLLIRKINNKIKKYSHAS